MEAGFETANVDMAGRKLVFRRIVPQGLPAATARHPLLGALKGLLTVASGVDLTEPAHPGWDKAFADKWARTP